MSQKTALQQITTASPALNASQIISACLYGALLWFLAALLVRFLGETGALAGNSIALVYLLVIPGTLPAVYLGRLVASLAGDQTFAGVSLMTATATLLDGLALIYFPALYGTNEAVILRGAALILWGAGVGLVLGLVMNKAPRAG
jgi:hypothetical protein